jgi:hypothetical protein
VHNTEKGEERDDMLSAVASLKRAAIQFAGALDQVGSPALSVHPISPRFTFLDRCRRLVVQ